jgi:hypothetical protein
MVLTHTDPTDPDPLVHNTGLYWYLNFKDEPLISCSLSIFHADKVNIWEKVYFLEIAATLPTWRHWLNF